VQLEVPAPGGVFVPVERYFPAETYPMAQEALLRHFDLSSTPRRVIATPGYFVPGTSEDVLAAEALLQGA
jgi:hypothetical protein